MSKYLVSIGIYCYAKDRVSVEVFETFSDNWKTNLLLHSEFDNELSSGSNLDWLSNDPKVAAKQLDENDLQVDIVFTKIGE